MLKYAFVAALLPALLLTSCSSVPETEVPAGTQPLAATSFENLDGWLADLPARATLTRDQAHTGSYSTMVGPGKDFSLGYMNALSRLSPEWPGQLTIGGWVLLPSEQAAAKLVTEVKGPTDKDPSLLWVGVDLAKEAKGYNKWQYVEQTITLPTTAKPDSRLLVYLWRADSKEPVYLDDLKITLAGQK
ncbi:hypothetical protein [Hymenobacter glacieicola]|uniref:CBM-cenC domain-containing protein n=1 Tax=Hymenobacter glacieicola TaxID=1562124 RepID=A0ABQ1WSZ1_9BACT|nr:hypothetical protein [Hymenobacter glacieicola]GGG44414.1 hypothetical protein GCM10011378_20940 [Hymenobacter glacieicola]